MKPARELFHLGDRVRLSDDGREQFRQLANNNVRGTVKGIGRGTVRSSAWKVRILLDGTVQPRSYLARYFELDPDATTTTDPETGPAARSGSFRDRQAKASAE